MIEHSDVQVFGSFMEWCGTHGVACSPARPVTVADFIADRGSSEDDIEGVLAVIARVHDALGYANPVASSVVCDALDKLWHLAPPTSWPRNQRARFVSLPSDFQAFIVKHDADQQLALRRAQNEAAKLRKALRAHLDTTSNPAPDVSISGKQIQGAEHHV